MHGLKWNGMTFKDGKQVKTFVSAYTKKQAIELVDSTYNHFSNYWSECGNNYMWKAVTDAGSVPGVWYYTEDYNPDTIKLWKLVE